METFKTLLFGIGGLSMIFWVAVIGIWHVDMFPRFFKEDREQKFSSSDSGPIKNSTSLAFIDQGALRPNNESIGLYNRDKYSRKS